MSISVPGAANAAVAVPSPMVGPGLLPPGGVVPVSSGVPLVVSYPLQACNVHVGTVMQMANMVNGVHLGNSVQGSSVNLGSTRMYSAPLGNLRPTLVGRPHQCL